jgi:hypothetical protein
MTDTDPEHPRRTRLPFSELMSDAQTLGLFSLLILGIGVVVVWVQGGSERWISLLWALGCLAVGAMAGFVFGIPRVQQDVPVDQPGDGTAQAPVTPIIRRKYKLLANTNLEQISDWLTKIIVGVGLVEAKEIPGYLGRLSQFIGPAIRPGAGGDVFALAITMHFAVWGFICAYLMTRVYLTGTFFRAEGGDAEENARTLGVPPPTGAP